MNTIYILKKRVLFRKKRKYSVKVIFAFFFLLSTIYSFSQDSIRISGQLINNTRFAKVVIQKFGTGAYDIAAIAVDKESGKFKITAPIDTAPGIYRFRYSQTGFGDYVDVIINGKDKEIAFSVDVTTEVENRATIFNVSDENKALSLFSIKQKRDLNAIRIKEDFLTKYPNKTDKSYQRIFKDYEKAKKSYQKQHQEFIDRTPFFWAKAYASYNQVNFTRITDHPRLQMFQAHENFWISKPVSDVLLLNTPLYTDAILSYIQYYMNPEMEFGEKEQMEGFKKCVNKIIEVFGENETTKEFAIKYLQLGFKELGNEEILQFIDEKYAATAQCTSSNVELQKRLIGYKTLKIGNLAPEIALIDNTGKTKTLKDYPQDEVIVVFWASWCPHCMEEMPKLQEWVKANSSTLVLAISLDDDFTAYQETIKKFPDMLHYCDLQKWNGKIVSDYYVAATPTFLRLDKERKILGKFSSFEGTK